MEVLKILKKNYQNINQAFILFFILVNLQEFIKVLKILINAMNQTP